MNDERRDVIVIGGSAGGMQALSAILSTLPRDLRAAIGVVLHRAPARDGYLRELLARDSALPIVEPRDGDRLRRGTVYLAPPDDHLIFERTRVRLDHGPRQHHTRPAIDPLFVSAATTFESRVCGVVLTGGLSDGVHGLIWIKRFGGLAIAQDPAEARAPSMPRLAIARDHVDAILPVGAIAGALARVARGEPVLDGARGQRGR